MLEKLQTPLFRMLGKRKAFSDQELHNYVLMLAVAIVACLVHVTFSVFFLIAGSATLATSHSIGVFIFVLAFYLLQHRHYDSAGILISFMILFSSISTIYTIGGDNFSLLYQYMVLLMQMVVPFSKKRIPYVFASLLPFIMVGSYLLDLYHTPLYSIGVYNNVLTILNIFINASGIVLLLSLEKLVRSFVESYKQRKYKELEVQAVQDPLTGLYNRRHADSYFSSLADSPPEEESYIAIADIDDFKQVNDTYGHDAGDIALRMISDIFTRNTRRSDLAFRWGGEEFLLIIHNVSADNAYKLLDKIRNTIQETPIVSEEATFHVTVTIGIAKLDPKDIPKSLTACDKKMYEGKRSTKNVVVM